MNPPIQLSEAQLAARRKGGRVMHQPEMLARRLARSWPELDDRTRAAISATLGLLVGLNVTAAVDLVVKQARAKELTDQDDMRLIEALFPGGDAA